MRILKFLHYQRYLGLGNLAYSKLLNCYMLEGNCSANFIHLAVQGILIYCIVDTFLKWTLNYQDTDSRSGDTFDHLVILSASFTQLFANAWMRLHQQSQLQLLQGLGRVAAALRVSNMEKLRARWFYFFWVFMCVYYAVDIVVFVIVDLSSQLDHLIFLLGFYVRLVCANFIITCYCSLVLVMKHLFRAQAAQLQHYLLAKRISLQGIAYNLHLNDKLLLLCQNEMVSAFGGALVLPYLYATLDAIEDCYLALPMDGFSYTEMLLILRWLIPVAIYLSMPMLINDLADEVS